MLQQQHTASTGSADILVCESSHVEMRQKYAQTKISALLKPVITRCIGLVGVFCVIHLSSCERESTAGLIKLETSDSATHTSYNPVVQFMDSSYMRARIRADWAKMYDKRGETLLGGNVQVEFFTKPERTLASILTSDSARIDDKTKNMTASGNVVVIAQGSLTTVKTSVIHWDSTRHVLHSSAFVDIRSPYEMLQGYGFESDANLRHYTIFKVTGQTMLSPNGEPIYATNSTVTSSTVTNSVQTTNTKQQSTTSTPGVIR
jgi:hypothetical protein